VSCILLVDQHVPGLAFVGRNYYILRLQNLFSFTLTICRWISVGSDLKFDARRDLDDVGATYVEGRMFMLALYQIVNSSSWWKAW